MKGRKKTPAKLYLCGLMLLFQHVHSKKRLGLCGRNSLSVLSSATQGLVAGALPSPRRTDEGDGVAGMRLCPNSTISTATKTASPDWFELQLATTPNETKQLRVKNEKNPHEAHGRKQGLSHREEILNFCLSQPVSHRHKTGFLWDERRRIRVTGFFL